MAERGGRLQVSVSSDGITIVELTDKKILDEVNIAHIGDQLNALVAETPPPKWSWTSPPSGTCPPAPWGCSSPCTSASVKRTDS